MPGRARGIRSVLGLTRLVVAGLAVAGLAVAGGPAASAATTPYRVQQTPRINGLLASVSCAGARFCGANSVISAARFSPATGQSSTVHSSGRISITGRPPRVMSAS